eukprot:g27182.t1
MKQCKIADNGTCLPDTLNAFYAQFEQNTTSMTTPAPTAPDTPVPSVTALDVRSVFPGDNPRKATGPDGVPGRALRSCADQLVEVFTDIFNPSLLQAEIPTCFKKTIIIPIPRKTHAMCLNAYHSIARTSISMKYFEGLVVLHINSS